MLIRTVLCVSIPAIVACFCPSASAIHPRDLFGFFEPAPGGGINDGGDDQFDVLDFFFVNGSPYEGEVTGMGAAWSLAPQTLGPIMVSGRLDFLQSNGTTTSRTRSPNQADWVYSRHYYEMTNTSSLAATRTFAFQFNLGSDSETRLASESSGNGLLSASDIWFVTDDADDGSPGGLTGLNGEDPAVGVCVADGRGVRPASLGLAADDVSIAFSLEILPGQSKSLLLFMASRNDTDLFPHTASRANSRSDVLALLGNPALAFAGLTAREQRLAVNFVPEPTSGAIVGSSVLIGSGLAGQARRRKAIMR